jgi:hypothetical protein
MNSGINPAYIKQKQVGVFAGGTIVMPVQDTQALDPSELQTQRDPGGKNFFGPASSQGTAPMDREKRAYPR